MKPLARHHTHDVFLRPVLMSNPCCACTLLRVNGPRFSWRFAYDGFDGSNDFMTNLAFNATLELSDFNVDSPCILPSTATAP